MHGESLCNCEVDPVCQCGNHKSAIEAHVFVAEVESPGALLHHELVGLLLPVEPQLALPLKLTCL